MKKIIIPLILIIVTISLYKMTVSAPKGNDHILVVGTNAEYPPYSFIKNREIVGFDIDIAKEVCKRLNKECNIHDFPFDSLMTELMLNKVDFIAAGMTPTKERAKKVSFTKSYYSNDTLVIVAPEGTSINSVQDLKGKNVVVNEGYTADTYATQFKSINLLRLPAPADAFLALKSQRADVFITAKSTMSSYTKENKSAQYTIIPVDHAQEGISLIVSKGNSELLSKIELTLESMKTDGTLETLKNKWNLK